MYLKNFKIPIYQSHRGLHQGKDLIENTYAALKESKRNGFEGVEMDLRLSADKQVILHHDHSLHRIYGDDHLVSQLTQKEIEKFQITKLIQVLQSKALPHFLNLEIKNDKINDFSLEIAVAELIKKNSFDKIITFSSFNPFSLWVLSKFLPMVPRALLVSYEKESGNPIYLRQMWFEKFIDYQFLNLDYRSFYRCDFYFYQKKGIAMNLWTLNDKNLAEYFLKLGVSSIITDKILPDKKITKSVR